MNYLDQKPALLVFGGSGFIGRDVCDAARSKGWAVMNADLKSAKNGVPFVKCDINNLDEIRTAYDTTIKEHGSVNGVAHLAAIFDYKAPEDKLYKVNARGTANVADGAVELRAKRGFIPPIIYLGAAASYGIDKEGPILETDQNTPLGPYGASKLEGELELLERCQNRGLKALSLRCAMVYGRDTRGTMIDSYINSALSLPIGTPKKNSWIHTLDIGSAIIQLLNLDLNAVFGRYECKNLGDILINLADNDTKQTDGEALEMWAMAARKPKKAFAPDLSGLLKFVAKHTPVVAKEFAANAAVNHILSNKKSKRYNIDFRFMDRWEGFVDVMSRK